MAESIAGTMGYAGPEISDSLGETVARPTCDSFATPTRLIPGRVVPGTSYRIVKWCGEGAVGVVYEAQHVEIGRRVAFKVLRQEVGRADRHTRQLRDEARTTTRIGSPYIVDVHDFGHLPDGRVWLSMELLDGQPLSVTIENGPMEVGRVISILRQLCKGLGDAHQVDVVHRDVKPDNIILIRDKHGREAVKIVDFGIAAVAEDIVDATHVAGTPHYMAPEQAMGITFDGRLDVYAVGCTAYEMLTGHVPFDSPSVTEVLQAQVHLPPPPLSRYRAEIPQALESVVLRCLAKQPDDRYPDMRELEAALCEAQVALGIQTPWDDLPLPEVDGDRRRKLALAMPEVLADGRIRRRRPWLSRLTLVAGLVVGASAAVLIPSPAEPEDLQRIESLVLEAHKSAGQQYYVFPPVDAPEQPTAYVHVVELEQIGNELAEAQAAELRRTFAHTLIGLGNRWWERDRAYAIDFYRQALLFDPNEPRARDRATFSSGELAELHRKASTLSFSPAELVATEPLAALAIVDPELRAEKLRAVVQKPRRRAASQESRLEQLLAHEPAERARVARGKTAANDRGSSGAKKSADATTEPTDVTLPSSFQRELARGLVRRGAAALERGNLDRAQALFRRALNQDPKNVNALVGLSDISFHQGAYDEAARLARTAVGIHPRDAHARLRLGDAYYKLFRYREAREQYVRAKRLGHREAAERLEKAELAAR